MYKGNKQVQPVNGTWRIRSVKFPIPVTLRYWTYLWISSGEGDLWSNEIELKCPLKALHDTLIELGVDAGLPMLPGTRIILKGINEVPRVDEAIDGIFNHHQNIPTFLLVILRSTKDPIYDHIKVICDIKKGIHNICVTNHNLAYARPGDTFCLNMAMKINLKLGGRNHQLQSSKLGLLSEGRTMVVGIDVTHPAPGTSKTTPSLAAVAASVDRFLSQWPATISVQEGKKEMVSQLEEMLRSRLDLWAEKNEGHYPDNVLIYRDGVSESQYGQVLAQELPLIRRACDAVREIGKGSPKRIRISIIIVGKRHHTRFFDAKIEINGHSNSLNGTIVDRVVTEYGKWAFYLQSHLPNKGVPRPSRYVVILDEIFGAVRIQSQFRNAADHLEAVTHNMCYLFGRCNRAVSVCPPVFYGHLACTRGRSYLSEQSNPLGRLTKLEPETNREGGFEDKWTEKVRLHHRISRSMFYI
ncbi:hypothetical protein EIK77_005476 [Talaromyces pinophilus]|nr:hypothetical protein EIK77_005476 [Talaromyces pinophilus]